METNQSVDATEWIERELEKNGIQPTYTEFLTAIRDGYITSVTGLVTCGNTLNSTDVFELYK